MNAKNLALAFGATFILVGILGFFPNPIVSPDGLFVVNTMHNLVHLITGSAFLAGALLLPGKTQLVNKAIGAAYALVAVIGFFTSGDMLLGLVHINQADRWLHAGLALVILAGAFALKDEKELSRA